MSRLEAIDQARSTLADGSFLATLAEWVAQPTESQIMARAGEIEAYLDVIMRREFESLGFSCRLFANPENGPPFLIAERHEADDFPTILGYGHGDVIRGQDEQWRDGLFPWQITEEGGRFYGRGTADNKGQLAVNLKALRAVLDARGGRLGWNARFLIEGGEELGSPGLHAFCREQAFSLRADALIASDGPRLSIDAPTIFLGSRGARNFTLRVQPRAAAHHSGNWGGLLANPAIVLAHAIACLVEASGRIRIPGLRPDGIPEDVRNALARCPVVGGVDPVIDPDWGEPGLTASEKLYGWNSFEVLALGAGNPAAPVSAIPGSATAYCQLRHVVGTDGDDVIAVVRHALDDADLQSVEVIATDDIPFIPTRTPLDDPWVYFASYSIERTLKRRPAILPNLGGSLPNDAFSDILGLPTIWIPHSYPGCNQHAPNEHLLASIADEGLAMMAGLYWDLGDASNRPGLWG